MNLFILLFLILFVVRHYQHGRKLPMPPSVGSPCAGCKIPLVGVFCTKCGHDSRLSYSKYWAGVARREANRARYDKRLRERCDRAARWVGRKLKWVGIAAAIVFVLFLITVFELWLYVLACAGIACLLWILHSVVSDAVPSGVRRGRS